jgi:hypothetical protein
MAAGAFCFSAAPSHTGTVHSREACRLREKQIQGDIERMYPPPEKKRFSEARETRLQNMVSTCVAKKQKNLRVRATGTLLRSA